MEVDTRDAIVARLADYETLVEVGIGNRTAVAAALVAAGKQVTATDIVDREVPDGVAFVQNDIIDPSEEPYASADAIYALNLPPELHRPTLDVARKHGIPLLFTTLGGDQPQIRVERETIAGDTLYRVTEVS